MFDSSTYSAITLPDKIVSVTSLSSLTSVSPNFRVDVTLFNTFKFVNDVKFLYVTLTLNVASIVWLFSFNSTVFVHINFLVNSSYEQFSGYSIFNAS